MEWKRHIVIQVLLLLRASYSVVTADRRAKRVINGGPLPDREEPGYLSPKYSVWIGSGPNTPDDWKYEQEACGGALLSTHIVQSACHCFCDFQARGPSGEELAVRNQNSFEVVVGCSEWKDQSPCRPIHVDKYMIHPMCRKIWGWISHDFALFTLKDAVYFTLTVVHAPVYELQEMATMWARITEKAPVCMVIGFGSYISRQDGTKSKLLRHGWQTIQNYIDCYDAYSLQSAAPKKANLSAYQEFATWSCMKPVAKKPSVLDTDFIGKGDSGSAITCNNLYFGLVSQAGDYSKANHTNTNDLIYYAYANSIYFRQDMIDDMLDPSQQFCHIEYPIGSDRLICAESAPRNFDALVRTGDAHLTRSSIKVYCFCTSVLLIIAVYL